MKILEQHWEEDKVNINQTEFVRSNITLAHRSSFLPTLESITQFSHLKTPLLCAGGAAFLILLVVIFTKLVASRASNGVNVNVQNSNTNTNDNTVVPPSTPVIPPSAPVIPAPTNPPTQLAYNYPEVEIQDILKKKGYLRTWEEREMVRQHSLRKKELQAIQESF